MGKTNTLISRISIIFLSIICTFAVLELLGRKILPKPQTIAIENLHVGPTGNGPVLDKIGLSAPDIFYRTPTGLRLRPNVRGIIDGHDLSKKRVSFSTNSLGYRHEELRFKTDTDVRILAVGDSITFQEYLPLEETYPFQVEKYIREHPPASLTGKQVDVINAGVGMIGSENELAILMETGLSVRPDIVLVEMYLNDARESFSLKLIKTPPLLQKSYLINSLVHTVNILRAKQLEHQKTNEEVNREGVHFITVNPIDRISSASWQTSKPAFNRLIAEYFQDWGYAWSDTHWKKMEEVFRLMKELSIEHKFQLVVALFPVRYQVESAILEDWPGQQFSLLMNKLNITHIDLLPILRKKFNDDTINLYYDSAHPTASGSAFIGSEIGKFFIENNIL